MDAAGVIDAILTPVVLNVAELLVIDWHPLFPAVGMYPAGHKQLLVSPE